MASKHCEPPPLEDSDDDEIVAEVPETTKPPTGLESLLRPQSLKVNDLAPNEAQEAHEEPVLLDEMLEAARIAKVQCEERKRQEAMAQQDSFASGMESSMKESMKKLKQKNEENRKKVEKLKAEGNEALSNSNLPEAIRLYSEAIKLDKSSHILYSNRAAARLKLREFDLALEDAQQSINLCKTWIKGYVRKATALIGLDKLSDAERSMRTALTLSEGTQKIVLEKAFKTMLPNEYKRYIAEKNMTTLKRDDSKDSSKTVVDVLDPETMKEALKSSSSDWANERLLKRIAANPKLSKAMQDPRVAAVFQQLQTNPQAVLQQHQGDKPMMELLNEFVKLIGEHFIALGEEQEMQQAQSSKADLLDGTAHIVSQEEAELQRQADQVLQDTQVREVLSDPQTRKVLEECGTGPGKLSYYMAHPKWGARIRLLGEKGLVKFQ